MREREARGGRILLPFRFGHHYKEEREGRDAEEDQRITLQSMFGDEPQVGVSQALKGLVISMTP